MLGLLEHNDYSLGNRRRGLLLLPFGSVWENSVRLAWLPFGFATVILYLL